MTTYECSDGVRLTPEEEAAKANKDIGVGKEKEKPPTCEKGQVLNKDETKCIELVCKEGLVKNEEETECVKPPELVCEEGEVKTKDLKACEKIIACEKYTKPNEDNKKCIAETCNWRQKLLEDGNCENCPSYTKASPSGKHCAADDCTKT